MNFFSYLRGCKYTPLCTWLDLSWTLSSWTFKISMLDFMGTFSCICGQNCVCSVSSTVLADPFHTYTSYQATSEGVLYVNVFLNSKIYSFGKFLKFVTLTLSCFDLFWLVLTFQYELVNSMGNHGAAGLSSEYRRSGCSSLFQGLPREN